MTHLGTNWEFLDYCCCKPGCCWARCLGTKSSIPPNDCLKNVPNSQWIYSEDLGYFQAFLKNTNSHKDSSPHRQQRRLKHRRTKFRSSKKNHYKNLSQDKTKFAGKISSSNNKKESVKFVEETRKKHQYEDANILKTYGPR